METLILENRILRAEFDPGTGAMTQLTSKLTGWRLIRRPDLGLSYRMLVPSPGKRSTYIYGESQPVASAEVSPDKRSVVFAWRNPIDQHGQIVPLEFTARVSLDEGGLRFSGHIVNNSSRTIECVAWPCVGDVTPSRPGAQLVQQQLSCMSLKSTTLHPRFEPDKGYWGTRYPTHSSANTNNALFILLAEAEQGFYVGCHEPSNKEMVSWFFERKPGYLDSHTGLPVEEDEIAGKPAVMDIMVHHFVFVPPSQSWDLSPIVVQPYEGNWQSGLDVYRRWRQSWFRPPCRPNWVEDVHSWMQIQIYDAEDAMNFRYEDLPDIARECKECGISVIQLTGWAEGGQDRGNPSHDIEPALGTREQLKDALRQAQEIGVRVILFCKWTWVDQSSPCYERHGRNHTAKNPYGYPYPAGGYQYSTWTQLTGLNTRPLIPTCTASPAWRDTAVKEFRKVLHLDPAGILFDECQHHGAAVYCFDREHDHPNPAYLYAYDVQFARELKQALDKGNEDFLLSGEACTDLEMQEYHLLYTRFSEGHMPAYRYIAPDAPIMMAVTGMDDRNQLNKCLQYCYIISYEPLNIKGRASDAPATFEYGRKIDALRRRYREFLWDGQFCGTSGARVFVDARETDDYSVYLSSSNGRRGVVVCNLDPARTVEVEVAFDPPDSMLLCARPECPDVMPFAGKASIAPRSVLVVMQGE